MKTKSYLTILGAIVACSLSSATAAITLNSSKTFTTSPTNSTANGGTTLTINAADLAGFNPGSSDKLVLTVSSEGNGGSKSISTVTFNGQTMTQAAFGADSTSQQITAIYFLDASVALGDLVVTFSSTMNGMGGSLLALSGTKSGIGSFVGAGGAGLSANLTTTAANSFVVATNTNNNNANTTISTPGTTTAQSPLTPLFNGFTGSNAGGSGYATVATAGAGTYSFTGATSRPATAVAAFAPIPEPSAALLGGLGMLCLLRRRR